MRLRRTLLATLLPAVLLGPALVLAPPAAAGGACRGQPVTTGKGQVVEMRENCFSPTVLHAAPGEAITFVNRDSEPHTVTGAGDWGTGHEELGKGDSAKIRLREPGLYLYTCLVHPGMMGAVYVGGGKGIEVAEGAPVSVASFTEDPAAQGTEAASSGKADEIDSEAAAAAGGMPATASSVAVLGLVALGAGYVLRHLRRRTSGQQAP